MRCYEIDVNRTVVAGLPIEDFYSSKGLVKGIGLGQSYLRVGDGEFDLRMSRIPGLSLTIHSVPVAVRPRGNDEHNVLVRFDPGAGVWTQTRQNLVVCPSAGKHIVGWRCHTCRMDNPNPQSIGVKMPPPFTHPTTPSLKNWPEWTPGSQSRILLEMRRDNLRRALLILGPGDGIRFDGMDGEENILSWQNGELTFLPLSQKRKRSAAA